MIRFTAWACAFEIPADSATFLPRILGVLMALAGVGWLIVLSSLAGQLSMYLQDPWVPRGSLADALAHCERSEYSAMEGARQCAMKAVV